MKYSFCILLVSAVVFLQACGENSDNRNGRPGAGQSQNAVSVETVDITTRNISEQIKSFGNIRAQEIVEVMPQVSNRVTQIYADLGDTVRQGETLAKIYAVPFRDQFQQAKAQLEQSRSAYTRDSLQFSRQQKLYDRGVISTTEFESARATFQNSKAALESSRASMSQSREDLKNTSITSPVYGVVLSRNISEGDLATTGQMAYEIGNLTGYQARVYLPLEEWKETRIGQKVDFRVSNQPDISGKGRVTQISPRLDAATGLGEVIISLTDRGPSIFQGVLVQAIINVETHENAVVIPRSALIENVQTFIEPESNSIQLQRSYSAFVIQDDTLAIRRELKLGIEQGSRVEVLDGLNPGEEVAITGQNNLDDSTRVRVADRQDMEQPSEIPIEKADPPTDSTTPDTSGSSTS